MAKRCEMQQCAIQAWDRYLSSRRGWLRGILESLPYVNAEVEAENKRRAEEAEKLRLEAQLRME